MVQACVILLGVCVILFAFAFRRFKNVLFVCILGFLVLTFLASNGIHVSTLMNQ